MEGKEGQERGNGKENHTEKRLEIKMFSFNSPISKVACYICPNTVTGNKVMVKVCCYVCAYRYRATLAHSPPSPPHPARMGTCFNNTIELGVGKGRSPSQTMGGMQN